MGKRNTDSILTTTSHIMDIVDPGKPESIPCEWAVVINHCEQGYVGSQQFRIETKAWQEHYPDNSQVIMQMAVHAAIDTRQN